MKIETIIVVLFLVVYVPATYALDCRGKIVRTHLKSTGELVIFGDWRNHYTRICNITTEWKNVPTHICKAWVSYTQAAKITGSQVVVQYPDDTGSCDQIPAYGSAPAPIYIMLRE